MESVQWRTSARIMAFISTVFSTIALLGMVFLIGLSIFAKDFLEKAISQYYEMQSNNTATSEQELIFSEISEFPMTYVWLAAVFSTICILIDLYAAVSFINATKLDGEYSSALHRARVWRNVCICFLVIGIVSNLATRMYLHLVINVAFRGIIIFFLVKFMKELNMLQTTNIKSVTFPPSVVVKY